MPYSRTTCAGNCSVCAACLSTFSSNPSSTAWAYSTSPRLTTSHSKLLVCTCALSLANDTPGTVVIWIPVWAVNCSKNVLRQDASYSPPDELRDTFLSYCSAHHM